MSQAFRSVPGAVVGIFLFLFSMSPAAAENPVPGLSDPQASPLTVNLFRNLKRQQGQGILFGQQYAVVQGQRFESVLEGTGRSDMLDSVGSLPAVNGYNINKLIDFKTGERWGASQIKALFSLGLVITFQWPADNPSTGGNADDLGGHPVQELVKPGTAANARWTASLDLIAAYLDSLVAGGEKIPVILRPMHEMTGGGNWYGTKTCTDAEYIAAWRYTADYLRKTKQVHNILLAFAPTNITEKTYFARYPGDDWVDILSFDNYDTGDEDYPSIIAQNAALVVRLASARSKIGAIAEAGYKKGIQGSRYDSWYMDRLLRPLKADPDARKVAYLLTWTNSSPDSYWVPLPGQKNYAGFREFCSDPLVVLARNIPDLYGSSR